MYKADMYIAYLRRRCAEIFGAMLEFLIKLCIFTSRALTVITWTNKHFWSWVSSSCLLS